MGSDPVFCFGNGSMNMAAAFLSLEGGNNGVQHWDDKKPASTA
jgi:hypothetical protein